MQVPPFLGGGQGSGCPPESHKSFLKATASSLHCLNWLLISSAHPNATDAKNSPPPPAVGQPLLHPNPMETSREWQAETLSSILTTPCRRKESRQADRQA